MQEVHNNIDGQATHRETVARYFSSKSEFWTVVYSEEDGACSDYMGYHMRRRRDVVLECLSEFQGPEGIVLDVGCGSGALVVAMAGMNHQVHGMDISEGMVAMARKFSEEQGLNPEHIHLGEVEAIPYDDGFFDVVTCVGVLEYVCDEKVALSELQRIIKTDGLIILTMPNILKLQYLLDPYYWCVRSIKYFFRKKLTKNTGTKPLDDLNQISTNANYTNRRYSYRQLTKIFDTSALVPVKWIGVGYGPFTFFKNKIFSEDFSKKVSDFLESAFKIACPRIGLYLTNRWVICLKEKEK